MPFGYPQGRTGMAMRRRFAGRTRTQTRRRTVRDGAGYIQWDKSSYQKSLGKLTQTKLNMANSDILDLIWKRTGRLDVQGQMFAGNWLDTTGAVHKAFRPIFLVDLTSGITQGATASPVVQLVRNLGTGATTNYVFEPVSGYTSTGGLSAQWQRAFQTSPAGVTPQLTNKSILKWTELRFDLWGSREHPVEWELTLCQLDEEVQLDPASGGITLSNRQGVDFWDQVSSKLCFSPSERKVANGIDKNMVKVLDRKSFILNPTSNTEVDADPHVRSVRLFYRMNRKVSFVWRNYVNATQIAGVDPAQNPGWDPNVASDQFDTAEPKARVYMMVTCKNWREPPTSYAELDTGNTATFNMSVYNRWVV